jgi:hypothetical protein
MKNDPLPCQAPDDTHILLTGSPSATSCTCGSLDDYPASTPELTLNDHRKRGRSVSCAGQVLPNFCQQLARTERLRHIVVAARRPRLILLSAERIRGEADRARLVVRYRAKPSLWPDGIDSASDRYRSAIGWLRQNQSNSRR